jgi:hypothetical protein
MPPEYFCIPVETPIVVEALKLIGTENETEIVDVLVVATGDIVAFWFVNV